MIMDHLVPYVRLDRFKFSDFKFKLNNVRDVSDDD